MEEEGNEREDEMWVLHVNSVDWTRSTSHINKKNTLKTIDGQMGHPPQHGLGMTGPGMRSVGLARPDQHAGLDRAYPQAAPTA